MPNPKLAVAFPKEIASSRFPHSAVNILYKEER